MSLDDRIKYLIDVRKGHYEQWEWLEKEIRDYMRKFKLKHEYELEDHSEYSNELFKDIRYYRREGAIIDEELQELLRNRERLLSFSKPVRERQRQLRMTKGKQIHVGPKGGKYILDGKKKIYLTELKRK
jgi:hypothetical protein